MQLTDIAAEEVCLPRVGIHVAHQVRAVLEGLLTHRALVWPLGAVRALVVHQVRGLAEALVTQAALEGLLPGVHPLVPRQLREMLEGLLADGAAVRLLHRSPVEGCRLLRWGRFLGCGHRRCCCFVGLFADGALDRCVAIVHIVVLGEGREEREAHPADPTDERLLLHLQTLVL